MKENAFTLIELLAVIVILAIIALIATPIILGIINDAKDQATLRSAEMYLKAVNTSIVSSALDNKKIEDGTYNILSNGNICLEYNSNNECINDLPVEIDGNFPTRGTIKITNGSVADGTTLTIGKTTYKKENGELVKENEESIPEPESFATDSWETIVANINSDKYKVGDTREIELKGFENGETDENGVQIKTYTIRIANKTNTGDVCTKEYFEKEDGTKETYSKTACGFVIEFEDLILSTGDDAKMNLDNINVGGWKDSKMRTYVNNTIYNALPEKLREKIIDTTVVSGYGSGDDPNKVSTDKVYLLSTGEVWEQGTSNTIDDDTARENTRQLDYYKDIAKVTTTSYSGAIKKYNGSEDYWWLRSAYSTSTNIFYSVKSYGDWYYNSAYYTAGVAVAFRIG